MFFADRELDEHSVFDHKNHNSLYSQPHQGSISRISDFGRKLFG
jgi:hypothetical protein